MLQLVHACAHNGVHYSVVAVVRVHDLLPLPLYQFQEKQVLLKCQDLVQQLAATQYLFLAQYYYTSVAIHMHRRGESVSYSMIMCLAFSYSLCVHAHTCKVKQLSGCDIHRVIIIDTL